MPAHITLQIIIPPQCYYRKLDLCLPLKWIFLFGMFLIVPPGVIVILLCPVKLSLWRTMFFPPIYPLLSSPLLSSPLLSSPLLPSLLFLIPVLYCIIAIDAKEQIFLGGFLEGRFGH